MKGKLNSDMGEIYIDNAVIAKCAGNTAIECFGIVGMATVSVTDGIVKLVKRENLTKGINVTVDEENNLTIEFTEVNPFCNEETEGCNSFLTSSLSSGIITLAASSSQI